MAEIKGALGAVFKGAAFLCHDAIAFVNSSSSITSLNDDFLVKGFADDMKITVYGTASNDGDYVIDTAAAGSLLLTSSVVNETPATSVMIYSSAPGTQVTGFYGWNITHNCAALDATDFSDAGVATYISGATNWSATAQAHWMSGEDVESLLGTTLLCRFFVKYSASPSAPAPVYCYEGGAVVAGISPDIKVDSIVERPLTFTGVGPLRLRSLTAYP